MPCEHTPTPVDSGFSPVLLFVLLDSETVVASVVSDSAWEERVITGADFQSLGPGVQDIVIHHEGANRQGSFEWKVGIQRRLSGAWGPTVIGASDEVVPSTTADGYSISAPYTDRARLGVQIRLVLLYRATAIGGGAVGDRQMLSLTAAVRPWAT